jgi:hypothetical protein
MTRIRMRAKGLPLLTMCAALLALSTASTSRACGYHDDVSVTRGALSWTYPDALHVIGAISSATMSRRLVHYEMPSPDLLGSQYRATAKALERFTEMLNAVSREAPPLSFSLVLIEPMLWTHVAAGPDGLRAQTHMSGPRPDDLVVVSGQDVIHAIANGTLGIDEAHALGLIRLYGTQLQVARFRAAIADIGERRSQNQTLHMRESGSRVEIAQ